MKTHRERSTRQTKYQQGSQSVDREQHVCQFGQKQQEHPPTNSERWGRTPADRGGTYGREERNGLAAIEEYDGTIGGADAGEENMTLPPLPLAFADPAGIIAFIGGRGGFFTCPNGFLLPNMAPPACTLLLPYELVEIYELAEGVVEAVDNFGRAEFLLGLRVDAVPVEGGGLERLGSGEGSPIDWQIVEESQLGEASVL
uniref:Uncharacterized protein n=1 Tax=Plectus sambesii TaxID=2011161 RepID=A0A914V2Y6_9BILA